MGKTPEGRDIGAMTPKEMLDAFDRALEAAAKRVAHAGKWSMPHVKSTAVVVEEPASHFEDEPRK